MLNSTIVISRLEQDVFCLMHAALLRVATHNLHGPSASRRCIGFRHTSFNAAECSWKVGGADTNCILSEFLNMF